MIPLYLFVEERASFSDLAQVRVRVMRESQTSVFLLVHSFVGKADDKMRPKMKGYRVKGHPGVTTTDIIIILLADTHKSIDPTYL
jgi:hypothetical protein